MFYQLRYSVLVMGDSPDRTYIMANCLATLHQLHYHVLVTDDGPDYTMTHLDKGKKT